MCISAAFYTPFFKEVWEKKSEIERAFHLEEEPGNVGIGSGLPDVAEPRPRPPPRADSYHLNHRNDGYQLPSSLDLLLGSQPENNMIHRGTFAKGMIKKKQFINFQPNHTNNVKIVNDRLQCISSAFHSSRTCPARSQDVTD